MRRTSNIPAARRARLPAVVLAVAALASALAACSGPILANAPAARPPLPSAAPPTPAPPADPQPVVLPRDDGPHDRLTEWWYYTGHLRTPDGRELGFEDVIFRAERGDFPVSWASHVAITDETNGTFHYAQRSEIGPQVDRSLRGADGEPTGFDLSLAGYDPSDPSTLANPPWTMRGSGGRDALSFELSPAEAAEAGMAGGMALDLALTPTKPAALHDTDGYADFGPAGGSYYYSRTRMDATGSIVVDGLRQPVEGSVWFDHQWGDFIAIGGGGWDWFAIELDDGTDLMANRVRAADGSYPFAYGTLVDPDGSVQHIPAEGMSIEATGTWASPTTGITYPSGWRVRVPGEGLDLTVTPTVPGQELDTRETTGVIYWEGSNDVGGTRDGTPVRGEAYVELTGYAGASATSSATPAP
jgi:predicted secreted hydrolase